MCFFFKMLSFCLVSKPSTFRVGCSSLDHPRHNVWHRLQGPLHLGVQSWIFSKPAGTFCGKSLYLMTWAQLIPEGESCGTRHVLLIPDAHVIGTPMLDDLPAVGKATETHRASGETHRTCEKVIKAWNKLLPRHSGSFSPICPWSSFACTVNVFPGCK